jgi:concanavalin A-like lectin/glucanase superfamily protein
MASPVLKVEIAFTSEPFDTTPTWVDVSQYVRATSDGGGGIFTDRGHGPEIGPFEAGTCMVTLSNRDRRFDPSYSAGPNFGNLIPRKQIRITATWSAVDYPMFYGWVTGWPQGFREQGKDATVTIEAIDAIAMLANMNLPNDLVFDYADTTLGSLALFLRGADIATWNDATSNGYFATFLDGKGQTSASMAAGSTGSVVTFDGSTRWVTNKTYTAAGAWSLAFWMQTSMDPSAGITFIMGGGDTGSGTAVYLSNGGQLQLKDGGGFSGDITPPVNDGVPHHIVFALSGGSTIAAYVDGVPTFTGTGFASAWKLDAIGTQNKNEAYGPALYVGSLQDIAVFDQELTAIEVEGLYQRSFGFLQESSADRITRLLDDVGWPAAWRDITTNPRASVGELVYNSASVLEKLQEVERSEQGMLFADKSGNVAFRERYYANEVTVGNTVQQIFSDDGGATALPYSTFGFQYNDIDITNDATVTTPTTWAKSSDATSITVNSRQSKKVDTILSTFDQANSMAAGLVAEGKDATYRVPPIMVYPENNTTRWDEVLGLELGYRVSMEITPMGVGSQNAQEVTLEQIEWVIVDGLWTLTIAGSPCFGGGGAEVGWFTIGTSLIGGPDVIGY